MTCLSRLSSVTGLLATGGGDDQAAVTPKLSFNPEVTMDMFAFGRFRTEIWKLRLVHSSSKKLLVAPGITTQNKKLLVARALLGGGHRY